MGRKHRNRKNRKQKRKNRRPRNTAISGKDGNAVGRAGEERVLKAFLHTDKVKSKIPDWWKDIRRGTPEEDERGIDHVVSTDVGDIAIQVKSSLHKDTDRTPARNDRNIPIVYVNLKDSDAEIRKRVIRIVAKERKNIS